jgi:hypothetical protein
MLNGSNDTAEIAVGSSRSTIQPGSIDPGALRRAMKFGQKARFQFGAQSFRDAERELRKMWEQRGEAADWEWVRAAVRAGFEPESIDDE